MCTIVPLQQYVVKNRGRGWHQTITNRRLAGSARMYYAAVTRMSVPPRHLQELVRLLSSKPPQDMAALLEDLLTPQELFSLAERWQIIQSLVKGAPQRDIADHLNTSISKITRGSRVVQYGKVNWKKLVSEMKK